MINAGVATHKNVVIFDEVTGIPSIMVIRSKRKTDY